MAISRLSVSSIANGFPKYKTMLAGFTTPSGRGVFGGGYITGGSVQSVIDYITFGTAGNTTSFGSLVGVRDGGPIGAMASTTRGVFGGTNQTGRTYYDYITIASAGNATTFGNLAYQFGARPGSHSSSTRAVKAGGINSSDAPQSGIEYITIATTGDGTAFGSLSQSRYSLAGCGSPTRAVFGGGNYNATGGGAVNTIDYVTIASTGNATFFGSLSFQTDGSASCSNGTRGIWAGGNLPSTAITNAIDYVTIATTGNGTSFGTLTGNRRYAGAVSSPTVAHIHEGLTTQGGTYTMTAAITQFTFASGGTAAAFGDLSTNRWGHMQVSSAHGGL